MLPIRFAISSLSLLFVFYAGMHSLQAQSTVEQSVADCRKESDTLLRLRCYDALADHLHLPATHYVQPVEGFLRSELRVRADTRDFALSVESFINLIRQAEFDDHKKIQVHGWRQMKQGYALDLTMREPLSIKFLFNPDQTAYSILQPVRKDGELVDPTQFVFVIAAMTPDK